MFTQKRLALVVVVAGMATAVAAQQTMRPADVEVTGHIVKPELLEPSPDRIGALKLPTGFRVTAFASQLGDPRILAVSAAGRVYVTRREKGDCVMLEDNDGDGIAETQQVVARLPALHGIAFDGDRVYLATIHDIYTTTLKADGTFAEVQHLVKDLPDAGQHADRTLAIGPDKMLYVSVGSTCNVCAENNPENATMLRMATDGSSRSIFASGLRNTIGFAFHPVTGELYGVDHGVDWLGDNAQQEELNLIARGHRYGWPYVFAGGELNQQHDPPGGLTPQQWDAMSDRPVALYTPHAAPMQLAFYTGTQFPAEYRQDAFVTMHGSWNRRPPSGYEIVRVRFSGNKPVRMEPFLTGFLMPHGQNRLATFGRPVGLAVAKDGALLFTDDANGMVYRVSYKGSGAEAAPRDTRTQPATADTPADPPAMPLAITRPETAPTSSTSSLAVSSSSFEAGQAIPLRFSDYGDKVSPALKVAGIPAGTQSLAVIVEDPDAKQPKPVVHWLLYNLPPATTALHELIPPSPRLPELGNALQGLSTHGNIGYFGPRPPKGDPAHHYHFEVFALDRLLDVKPGVEREVVLSAMKGHVLARAELQGTFEAPKQAGTQ